MSATKSPDSDARSYYAMRAAEYDGGAHHRPEREPEVRYLEDWIPRFFVGKHVLEVASGMGHWTHRIAPVAASIVATDPQPDMLEISRRRNASKHVRWMPADAYRLRDDLGYFEAAFAGFWFSHIPKHRIMSFLQSLHRRLEPGATVVMIDNSAAHSQDMPPSASDAEGNTFQVQQYADGSRFNVLKNFPTEKELVAAIEPFGVNVRVWRLNHFWVLAYENRAGTRTQRV